MARGSARSVPGIDIGAIVRAANDAGLLEAGGGHAMAAGFSLTRGTARRPSANSSPRVSRTGGEALAAALDLHLDALVSPSGATAALVRDIAQAGPFGAGNPEPLVVVTDVRVVFADVVGKDHVRLRLAGGDGARLDAIAFRAADTPLGKGLLASRGKAHPRRRAAARSTNGTARSASSFSSKMPPRRALRPRACQARQGPL